MTLPRPLRALRAALGALSIAALPLAGAAALTIPMASLLVLTAAPAALAQEEDDQIGQLLEQAMGQLEEKDFDGALQTYATVLRRVEAIDAPEEAKASVISLAQYNSACALALQGKKEQAIDRFEKSLEAGFEDWDHIVKDTDLDSIRGEDRFKEIVSKFKKKGKETKPAASSAGAMKAFLKQITKGEALFPFDFDVKDVNGDAMRLADMKGQVVLVDVWGTWCPPCRAEVPHLAELHRKHGPKGFAVMGLACERVPQSEAAGVVRKFLADNDVPYRSASIDSKFPQKNIPDFEGFPTLLLVDRAGKVRMKVVGYTEADLLDAAVQQLLAEAPPADVAKPTPATPGHGHGEGKGHGEGHGESKGGRREF